MPANAAAGSCNSRLVQSRTRCKTANAPVGAGPNPATDSLISARQSAASPSSASSSGDNAASVGSSNCSRSSSWCVSTAMPRTPTVLADPFSVCAILCAAPSASLAPACTRSIQAAKSADSIGSSRNRLATTSRSASLGISSDRSRSSIGWSAADHPARRNHLERAELALRAIEQVAARGNRPRRLAEQCERLGRGLRRGLAEQLRPGRCQPRQQRPMARVETTRIARQRQQVPAQGLERRGNPRQPDVTDRVGVALDRVRTRLERLRQVIGAERGR